ncbi:MAG TPA: UDP-glucose/GDP-mannose dehydrogenase family protein, partial [Alcanivorax sp.]|nr:UDP-glucose/GDP-mannose dehydrogenase family protein [Alcanivorax sp.]
MRIDVFGDTLCASVTAAALAQSGHEVCWFIPEGRVLDAVNEDRVPYREPGLGELLGEQRAAGRLRCEPMTLNGAPAAPAVFLALQ